MTVKALPPRLVHSYACSRRRLLDAPRRMHQAVAHHPPSQLAPSPDDHHLYALYEDLMAVNSVTTQIPQLGADTPPTTDDQRDMLVKAHITSASLPDHSTSTSTTQQFPTTAIALLHQYEAGGHFAPIKSYTRVISALFNVQTSPASDPRLGRAAAQAHAWDLFAHMRYVAHPIPDIHLYTLMISACGLFSRPEPERAMDLWKDMQENGIEPTKEAYEALIRVCGRAGSGWLGEGMRLAREMSDRFSMNGRRIWCALLEGCKRVGDLKRARWILAEAVRGSGDDTSNHGPMVDTGLMTHVFHTYASYKPPFKSTAIRLAPHMFSRLVPQTSSDVIAETQALFNMITGDELDPLASRFAHVELTPALINAYLSVFYRHASIETLQATFDSLFNDSCRVHPDEYTYVNALERCAMARTTERCTAVRWAKDIWQRWEAMEARGLRNGKGNVGSFARLIERAHAAMRRTLVLSGDVDGALALLRSFVSRFPPNAVMQPISALPDEDLSKPVVAQHSVKHGILSTRTILMNPASSSTARPLVRLTSAATPKDDRVPPIITFSDVDLLHARLTEHGRIKDLGYIKWACMAYAGALKRTRSAVLKATPTMG